MIYQIRARTGEGPKLKGPYFLSALSLLYKNSKSTAYINSEPTFYQPPYLPKNQCRYFEALAFVFCAKTAFFAQDFSSSTLTPRGEPGSRCGSASFWCAILSFWSSCRCRCPAASLGSVEDRCVLRCHSPKERILSMSTSYRGAYVDGQRHVLAPGPRTSRSARCRCLTTAWPPPHL